MPRMIFAGGPYGEAQDRERSYDAARDQRFFQSLAAQRAQVAQMEDAAYRRAAMQQSQAMAAQEAAQRAQQFQFAREQARRAELQDAARFNFARQQHRDQLGLSREQLAIEKQRYETPNASMLRLMLGQQDAVAEEQELMARAQRFAELLNQKKALDDTVSELDMAEQRFPLRKAELGKWYKPNMWGIDPAAKNAADELTGRYFDRLPEDMSYDEANKLDFKQRLGFIRPRIAKDLTSVQDQLLPLRQSGADELVKQDPTTGKFVPAIKPRARLPLTGGGIAPKVAAGQKLALFALQHIQKGGDPQLVAQEFKKMTGQELSDYLQ